MVSGVEEARRAVREQIGHRADLIKVYADWNHPTLTVDEIRVIVEEAHKQGLKVAAHATTPDGIKNAVTAGADSIEHGHGIDRADLELMKSKGTFLVPTVGVIDGIVERRKNDPLTPEQQKHFDAFLQGIQQEVQMAMSLGVKIVAGFDAAEAEGQAKNANEPVSLTKRGMPPLEAIRAATTTAAELMGWEDKVGALEPGHYADVIAVEGDPLTEISQLRHVQFVMKGGTVVKTPYHWRSDDRVCTAAEERPRAALRAEWERASAPVRDAPFRTTFPRDFSKTRRLRLTTRNPKP